MMAAVTVVDCVWVNVIATLFKSGVVYNLWGPSFSSNF